MNQTFSYQTISYLRFAYFPRYQYSKLDLQDWYTWKSLFKNTQKSTVRNPGAALAPHRFSSTSSFTCMLFWMGSRWAKTGYWKSRTNIICSSWDERSQDVDEYFKDKQIYCCTSFWLFTLFEVQNVDLGHTLREARQIVIAICSAFQYFCASCSTDVHQSEPWPHRVSKQLPKFENKTWSLLTKDCKSKKLIIETDKQRNCVGKLTITRYWNSVIQESVLYFTESVLVISVTRNDQLLVVLSVQHGVSRLIKSTRLVTPEAQRGLVFCRHKRVKSKIVFSFLEKLSNHSNGNTQPCNKTITNSNHRKAKYFLKDMRDVRCECNLSWTCSVDTAWTSLNY